MAPQDPKNEGKRHSFLRFMKKIIIWSAILFVLEKVVSYSGWDTWSKFEESANKFGTVLLNKVEKVSPIYLFHDLRSERGISIIDTAVRNAVDRYNSENMQRIFRHVDVSIPMEKYYHPEYHTVTIWEKIRDWGRAFWYNYDNTANWFGRIILFTALLVAIPLTRTTEQNRKLMPLASNLYLLNILVALFYITIYFSLVYILMEIILVIAGSIVALFTTLVGTGGIVKLVAEELKFETTVHFKKKIGP